MAQTATHPTPQELEFFALGRLGEEQFSVVENHVSACFDCEAAVSQVAGDTFTSLLQSARSLSDTGRPLAAEATAFDPGANGDRTSAWEASADEVWAEPPAVLANHPRYRPVRRLGSGGMGAVWLAEHRVMGRQVAVKVIRPEFVAKAGAAERFRRETQTAAMLAHPNIVTAFDAEQVGETHLLAMEYLDGVSLADELRRRGPLPVAEACDAVRQAALGLQHAHECGLVHRDVKPQNLMRTADGVVKVLDFGLAVLADANRANGGLTGGGVVMGTPDYIAPEQAEDARSADVRSDVYSLGCTLYHLLTGRVPFPVDSVLRKLDAHRHSEPESVRKRRPEVSAALAAVVAKMMAKKPADRYQTPAAVVAALHAVESAKPPARRRWRVVAAALLGIGVFVAAVAVYRIQTDKGDIVINVESPDVEIVLLKGGKEVEIIDTKTNKRVRVPTGTYDVAIKNKPEGIEVMTDGPIVVSRGKEVLVRIERVEKKPDVVVKSAVGDKIGEVLRKHWENAPVTSGVDLSPDGRLVLSMHWGGVRVWNVSTGEVVHEWAGSWLGQFTLDGKQLVITIPRDEAGNCLRLHDTASRKVLRTFGRHPNGFESLRMSPDGRTVITSDADGAFQVWELTTGERLKSAPLRFVSWTETWGTEDIPEFQKRTGIVPEYRLPGGREVMGRDPVEGQIPIYEISSGRLVRTIPLQKPNRGEYLGSATAYGRRFGERMAFSFSDGTVCVLDLVSGKEVARFSAGDFQPKCLVISANGRFVAACASNQRSDVVVWGLPELPAKDKP